VESAERLHVTNARDAELAEIRQQIEVLQGLPRRVSREPASVSNIRGRTTREYTERQRVSDSRSMDQHVLELSHLRSEVGELRAELAHVSSTMIAPHPSELSPASAFIRSRSVDAFRARRSAPQELCSGSASMTVAHHLQREFVPREEIQSSGGSKRQSLGSCTSARSIHSTPTKLDYNRLRDPYPGFSPMTSRHSLRRRAATPRLATSIPVDCWSSQNNSCASLS